MTAETTPPGNATTAREALTRALVMADGHELGSWWANARAEVYGNAADILLAGPLSAPAVVAQLAGAAGLVRELDEANELGAVTLAVALALEEARAKLAQVEKYAGVLADTGPRVYAGSEIARMLRIAIGATP